MSDIQSVSDFFGMGAGPFNGADALWASFQNEINSFVSANGGISSINDPLTYRPDWDKVLDVLEGRAPLSTLSKDCAD